METPFEITKIIYSHFLWTLVIQQLSRLVCFWKTLILSEEDWLVHRNRASCEWGRLIRFDFLEMIGLRGDFSILIHFSLSTDWDHPFSQAFKRLTLMLSNGPPPNWVWNFRALKSHTFLDNIRESNSACFCSFICNIIRILLAIMPKKVETRGCYRWRNSKDD